MIGVLAKPSSTHGIWMPTKIRGVGGPASFQRKLVTAFQCRGISVGFAPKGYTHYRAALVINATRHSAMLLKAKVMGTRILQRLGSPFPSNSHQAIPVAQRMRLWLGDQNVALTRRYLADRIVYQSFFVKECWEKKHGRVNKPSKVIYNGVDLSLFSPDGPKYDSSADICIISVEGTQIYPEHSPAFLVAQEIKNQGLDVELLLFGSPWADSAARYASYPFINFMGPVANDELPYYYRGASIYVLNDIINAGCPNSVIEALACGVPVIGYTPGVLPEMLTPEAGKCVPALGDPWKGEPPGNIQALADAAMKIIENNWEFRRGARQLAEERYGLEHMVDHYIKVLFE
ncbi:MAG: glycosyltransferase [Desulfobacteraceae bacterium]|nr:MAG: glycosyltransferase [Desulfobacteraceae bacterium]